MPTSLEEAARNAQDDLDVAVIDEFRKESIVLDTLEFDDCVNPSGGGATLTYGYRRLVTQPTASTRAINSEYTPHEVTTQRYTTDLAVMGGSFKVDRIVGEIGPAASNAVSLNMAQKIKATRTTFQDLVINGDTAIDENGFDGLDKALRGSDTEFRADSVTDVSDLDTDTGVRHQALDALDEFLHLLDGDPTVILGNAKAIAKVRAIVRRTGMYTRDPVEGLLGQGGRPIVRETYGGIVFADPGTQAGSTSPIIPVQARSDVYTVEVTGSPTGGTYTLTVSGQTTDGIAYDANAAAVKAALEALDVVGTDGVTVTGTTTKTITFASGHLVVMSGDGSGLTGGTSPAVAVSTSGGNAETGLTDLYAYRVGMDAFHGVSTTGGVRIRQFLPDFQTAGAVKLGEVELGPVAVALKATKAAAVFRNFKVQ